MAAGGGSIAVIDYGMGNLHSVVKALQHVAPGARVSLVSEPNELKHADRVVLPGVGAIRDCMAEVKRLCFDEALIQWLQLGRPMLGICVGMQMLLEHSAENGGIDGLDLMPGRLEKLPGSLLGKGMKIPLMGWSQVRQLPLPSSGGVHPLFDGIEDGTRFYFVHSYYADSQTTVNACAETLYEVSIAAAIARDNIFATQFHPEKSHDAGLRLLANFTSWSC